MDGEDGSEEYLAAVFAGEAREAKRLNQDALAREAWIAKTLAEAPPLSPETIDRVRVLLFGR